MSVWRRWTMRHVLSVTIGVALGLTVAVPAVASSTNQHTVSGTTHGHTIPSLNDMHALTVRLGSSGSKHASVDHKTQGTSICQSTGTWEHVHCDVYDVILSAYGSHHWGPSITDHKHNS